MLAGTLAFVAGIYCLMQLSSLPSLWFIVLIPLLLFITRFFSKTRIVLFFFLGFFWALCCAYLKMNQTLDADIENTNILISGVIVSVPETYKDHIRFLIDIKKINKLNEYEYPSPGLVRLSWYEHKSVPVPGELWQLKVKLKRPYSFMNPGGFDYEAWMLRQNIKATGYVKYSNQNRKISDDGGYFIQKIRSRITNEIKLNIKQPLLGLVLALTLGDRSQLDTKQWSILSRTGTNHLIAISGLHLSLVAGFVYFLAGFIWSQFYFLTQRIPTPLFASVMAFVGAFFYALLSGFALPAQRALIMIAVFLLAMFSIRQVSVTNVICVAVMLVLVIDPFAINAVDFYLSFMAVIFIVYISRFRISKFNNVTKWIRLQCLLSIALCPLLILWFNQIPVYSVFANLISIPVIGFIIVPLMLIALILLFPLPEIAHYIYVLIDEISALSWRYLEFLSQQNYAVVPFAAANTFSISLTIIGVLILMMPRGLPARFLALFFFIPLLFPINEKMQKGEFEFVLLDVGQGLAAIIQTERHTLIYDTGAKFSERFNIGDAVIKSYLRKKRINQISMLIVSHGDNDHIGGASAIIDNFKINKILSSVPSVFAEKYPEQSSKMCLAGDKWHWDGVDFEIIHPYMGYTFTGNNASCVLRVSSEQGTALLTGDIEKEAEASLVNHFADLLHADILLVPHHGSKTSSTERFISAVSPEYAFISAGYKNRFGFPKKDIIERYNTHAVKTFVSYKNGEISAKFRDKVLQIDEFRTKNRRFWHH